MSLSLLGVLLIVVDAEGISGTDEAPRRVKNAIFSLKTLGKKLLESIKVENVSSTHLNEIMSGLFFSTFVLRNL